MSFWSRLGKPRRTDGLELWSSFTTFSWGVILSLPGDTFSTTKAYRVLASWGGEPFWIGVCLVVASIQWVGLSAAWLTYGRYLRIVGATCGCLFWLLLAFLLLLGNPIGHGWMLYFSLSVGLLVTAIMLARDTE